MDVQFVTSVAVIAPDPPLSRRLFVDTIGLPLEGEGEDGYHHSEARVLSPEGAIVGISYAPAMHPAG